MKQTENQILLHIMHASWGQNSGRI